MPLSPRVATPVKRKPSWDFSLPGLMYFTMMMFMGVAAMNTQANLLFGVFGLMIGVLLISIVISRLVLARLTVRRGLPDAAIVGRPTTVGYEFDNGKRFWPSLSVQVAELDGVEAFQKQPHAYLLHAARGTKALVEVEVTPKRRGLYALDQYQIATSFPFGFIKRAVVRHQDDSLLVFPALAKVDPHVLTLLQSAETAGVTVRPRRGGEDEIYGVKEYRQGENPRLIHWKRSARMGSLVVREMTRVSPPRVMLVVDTRLNDGSPRSYETVERTIAIAASLASMALEQGLMVGLTATKPVTRPPPEPEKSADRWGKGKRARADVPPPVRDLSQGIVFVPPNRGKRQRRELLSELAQLSAHTGGHVRGLIDHALRNSRAGTTPVLVTAHEVEPGLAEQTRSSLVVLSTESGMVRKWFDFPPGVDFSVSMPADQQPELEPAEKP